MGGPATIRAAPLTLAASAMTGTTTPASGLAQANPGEARHGFASRLVGVPAPPPTQARHLPMPPGPWWPPQNLTDRAGPGPGHPGQLGGLVRLGCLAARV